MYSLALSNVERNSSTSDVLLPLLLEGWEGLVEGWEGLVEGWAGLEDAAKLARRLMYSQKATHSLRQSAGSVIIPSSDWLNVSMVTQSHTMSYTAHMIHCSQIRNYTK